MIVLQTAWFFLPAAFANMAPSLLRWIPVGGQALDRGQTFRRRRLLGDHKTIRGLIVAPLIGAAVFWIQRALSNAHWSSELELVDAQTLPLGFGAALGFGAILGDAIKSFFKRQLDIPSGKPWFPFDQMDFMIGALVVAGLFFPISFSIAGTALLLSLVVHPLANLLGYLLHLQPNKL